MTTPVIEPAGRPEESGAGGLVGVQGVVGGPGVPDLPGAPEIRLRLEVAYDGADFCGWARQPGLRSVQAELESALRAVLRIEADIPVRVAVAGRTDAGVHAVGQVCHSDVPAAAWAASLGRRTPGASPDPSLAVRRRLNGLLPPDLRVRQVGVAPAGFDARWSASWRRYSYLVADDPAGQDPRTRGHVLWHPRALDVEAMDAAAAPFVGEHDFAAYCRAREGASSVRTLHDIGWRRVGRSAGASSPVEFSVRADAFCHSMVRSLVGAFIAVGDGRWPLERPAELLAAAERVPVIETAPAHPLTLVEVGYPPESDLAAQAERARRWRGR
ncbi:MAG TPA: tRNA pseudouridine(38-40) synthase TruA [Candidatus Limnocylindrales bacterium]|nr:tRNA pseudouridine(38-40) synthase TruA [Candidatus Limnocylindrales bacterium]